MEALLEKLYNQKLLLEDYYRKITNLNFKNKDIIPINDKAYIEESIKIIEDDIKYLIKNKNTYKDYFGVKKISEIKELDLILLFEFLDKYYIKYRNKLGINKRITFGIEMEFDNYNDFCSMYDFFDNNNISYNIVDEPTTGGFETNSCIMNDTNKNWIDLKKICSFLKENNATTINGNAGGHIHIGLQIFKNYNNYDKFLKCYKLYEDILNRFLCGEYVNIRKSSCYYANLCKDRVYEKEIYFNRSKALFVSQLEFDKLLEKNTIEFRRPNGTLEEVIWQNNINALIKMILTINKDDFDIEYINYSIKKDLDRIKHRHDSAYDSEVNIKKVVEFVDMFYEKPLDKINFLKQYFKDYELSLKKKELVRTKKFWY